ncbi:EPIDERMAL PATTERNING FACTOR-like protein 2 [Pyrus ussuriensis x Pyrus communis]|uniref:Epidermal patterning factor-like protein n=1 Tax=Pyrus ussuriensis x Pyrus communis TaxID=2448454 RepID=A0A5N5GWZ4_9ROSA|nr:EPIDERMAL PATTERNING FACTOR-like protein 2 [Pyrus x bretschneideri]KAB2617643.1 EPIDERMAL PATTERNING FACTOR-like protein 2 [Pyrus ussuriensis x Pyrus communis]KAB2617660.1 EPIDERMAL PATTERNING FACTOR-like protein 2 [Pyrus ussuriensis x Pyrus communis]
MGCFHFYSISLVFLLILCPTHFRFCTQMAESREIHNKVAISQTGNEESKVNLRGQVGSRPPRCERRCSSCGHCEAIQVPATPQANAKPSSKNPSKVVSGIAYARGDENSSNYKPMSWKCKCGSYIFNP